MRGRNITDLLIGPNYFIGHSKAQTILLKYAYQLAASAILILIYTVHIRVGDTILNYANTLTKFPIQAINKYS